MATALSDPSNQRSPWVVAVGAGLAGMVATGPIFGATLGSYVVPMSSELGWSRTEITSGYVVAALGMALGLLVVGRLLQRFSVKAVAIPSFLLFPLVGMGFSLVTADSLWLYYLIHLGVGLCGSGTSIPLTKAIVSWFDRRRGAAIGVSTSMWTLSNSATPIVAVLFINSFGWRNSYVIMAAISLAFGAAIVGFLVHARGDDGKRALGSVQQSATNLQFPGTSLRETMHDRHFWMITLSVAAASVIMNGFMMSMVPMMTDRGMGAEEAASLVLFLGASGITGRRVGGILLDRFDARRLAAAVFAMPIVGILLFNTPYWLAALSLVIIGFALGAEQDIMPYFLTRYFGLREFGKIIGVVQSMLLVAAAIGPLLLSIAFDVLGSYEVLMPYFCVAMGCASIVSLLLGPYRYELKIDPTEQGTDEESSAAAVASPREG